MDSNAKKLARLEALKEDTATVVAMELERVDFAIDETNQQVEDINQKIDEVQDGAMQIVDAVNKLDQTKADKEDVAQQIENIARMPGRPGNPGKDGKDYILTPKDKDEIATKIKVPVVEKVIEKTEVIKEQPVITNIENPVTPDDVINKIHESSKKIKAEKIDGLEKIESKIEEGRKTLERRITSLPIWQGISEVRAKELIQKFAPNAPETQDLQAVTDLGATTTNTINIPAVELQTDYTPTGSESVGTTYWNNDGLEWVTSIGAVNINDYLPTTHLTDFTHEDIAHANRASLDLVSGTNTGDQDLSGYAKLDGTNQPFTGAIKVGDNVKHFFGTGDDASITYNGTNLVINPREVGAGNTIFSTGDVGIGTTTPTEKLEIDGNLFLNGDNDKIYQGTGKDYSQYFDGTNQNFELTSGDYRFKTANLVLDNGKWLQGRNSDNSVSFNILSMTGANDLDLRFPNNLRIKNNEGTEYARINANGIKVGPASIGTDSYTGLFFQDIGATADYSIHRTSGAWSGPNYQQLLLDWQTGVIIDGGSAYGKSGTVLQPNGGNVGIGTTAPEGKTHIYAGASGGAASNSDDNFILEDNGNSFINLKTPITGISGLIFSDATRGRGQVTYSHATDALRFVTAGFQRATIDSTGNVGIGTTAPARNLHVAGDIYAGTVDDGISIRQVGGIGEILGINAAYSAWNDIGIRTGSATQLYLKTTGNVGIGTTAPGEKLEVAGNVFLKSDNDKFYQGTGKDFSQYFDGTNENFKLTSGVFKFSSASNPTAVLSLTGAGVGTRQEIINSGDFTAGIILQNSTGRWGFNTITGGHFSIYDYNSSSYKFRIQKTTGNVGIGTNTPTEKLSVAGRIIHQGTFAEIYVADGSTAQTIPTGATYTKLTAFTTNGESSNATADATNDKITLTKTGRYKVEFSMSFNADIEQWRASLFVGGVEIDKIHFTRSISNATDVGNAGFVGIIDITSANTDIDVRVRHDSGTDKSITVEYANLNTYYLGET